MSETHVCAICGDEFTESGSSRFCPRCLPRGPGPASRRPGRAEEGHAAPRPEALADPRLRNQLRLPAVGLALSGLTACFGAVVALDLVPASHWMELLRTLLFCGPVVGGFLVWCALSLWKLESYRLAKLGCLVCLLPVSLGVIPGLVAGVWGLVVLNRPAVRRLFQRWEEEYRASLERALDEFDSDLREP
jgi:hypothetical protein